MFYFTVQPLTIKYFLHSGQSSRLRNRQSGIRWKDKKRLKNPVSQLTRRNIFLIIQPTRCTNFSKFLFWNETLHVSDSSSVHRQEFSTVHTPMVYVIQVFRQLASRIRMEHPDPARKFYLNRMMMHGLADIKKIKFRV